ncbi:cupin-like domain containing protein [Nitzschia inconspicua]|uniref:Cupin-like domain containing protein n=1 Tax=Nitzschia inconspicua TaxID=303405 RepID=A0A9K3KRT1_9STRA|nr:cupin-like domain containing protein [Nitzschia inconspicua]
MRERQQYGRNDENNNSEFNAKRVKFSSSPTTKRVTLSDFTCIQDPHPFGVLPGGNQFFISDQSAQPSFSKSLLEQVLDDKLWQTVLSYCDAKSLGNAVQVSRYLYVAGHQSELWRDLVLRQCDATKIAITKVAKSWKDTYVLLFHTTTTQTLFVESRPMNIPGIYSDTIYQSHFCRSFAIPDAWLVRNDGQNENCTAQQQHREIPFVSVESISPQEFFSQYEETNQPVVIQGAANGKAVDCWNNWVYLQAHSSPTKTFRTTSGAAPLSGYFTLDAYRKYIEFEYLEESPLYLFDRNAFVGNEQWEDDFFPDFYRRCPYWDPSGQYGHDLLQHLGSRQRPDHTWLIAGPKRSGSVFHIDPNCTHAWNACIQGRKRWIFYPPGDPPPGVLPSLHGDEVALPLSVGEWIVQYWEEHMEQYRQRPVGSRPMECTTFPGDVIFVPHGWWHSVINLDDVNIAITHNYLSPSNLGNALKFFVEKQDHISGCRDRAESIKPEMIHDALVEALRTKEPKHLEKAMAQTEWTCRAWSSQSTNQPDKEQEDPTSEVKRKTIMEQTEPLASFTFSFL